MNVDFLLVFSIASIVCMSLILLDKFLLQPSEQSSIAFLRIGQSGLSFCSNVARLLLPVFLSVFLLRAFVAQPWWVPTGSLQPTIRPGDCILVNQFIYGLRLPIFQKKMVAINEPKRGDLVVFHSPAEQGLDLVKRVIGVPGDFIVYRDKMLYINGRPAHQSMVGLTLDREPTINQMVEQRHENLLGISHDIFVNPYDKDNIDFAISVPSNAYFVMGDNRDNSEDSRYWGFVPEANLIGRAMIVLFSWDSQEHRVRWERIGSHLQ